MVEDQETKDGGVRGWFVVLGGFGMISIVAGVRRSMGLIFLEVLEMCQAPARTVSLVVSCYFFCCMAATPVVTAMVRRFGTRIVVCSGGMLASTALFCASFAKTVEMFIILIGILTGCGHACTFVPTMVLVSRHFRRRRTLAVGLCGCGGAVGALVVPPLLAFTSNYYGGPGMLMILAGLNLHIILASTVMRPPDLLKTEEQITVEHDKCVPSIEIVSEDNGKDINEKERLSEHLGAESKLLAGDDLKSHGSALSILNPNGSTVSLRHRMNAAAKSEVISSSMASIFDIASASAQPASAPAPSVPPPNRSLVARRLCCHLPFYEVTFAIASTNFLQPLSFYLTPLLAEDLGLPRMSQSVLLLVAGFTDIVARLVTGLTSDRFPRHRFHLYLFLMLTATTNWSQLSVLTSYLSILCFSLVHGAVGAAHLTLSVQMMVDILGVDNLDVAMSFMAAFQAPLLFVVPPTMALVSEWLGSWRSCCFLGVFLCCLAIVIMSRQLYRRLCVCCRRQDQSGDV